jgi:hypothetical protein
MMLRMIVVAIVAAALLSATAIAQNAMIPGVGPMVPTSSGGSSPSPPPLELDFSQAQNSQYLL